MSFTSSDEKVKEFYEYALSSGFQKEAFFSKETMDAYIETSLDGYQTYPLFLFVFNGTFKKKVLRNMMSVDYRSRLSSIVGVASSTSFESVLMAEPPCVKKTGMGDYAKMAKLKDFLLLLQPGIYKHEAYEDYALERRKAYMDDKTWYIYIFATKKSIQRSGHGKRLMNLMISFAKEKGYRICLETDLKENVAMYEKFGFHVVDQSVYNDALQHFVMVYE